MIPEQNLKNHAFCYFSPPTHLGFFIQYLAITKKFKWYYPFSFKKIQTKSLLATEPVVIKMHVLILIFTYLGNT